MSAPFWMVLEDTLHVRYASETAARAEAERLARLNPRQTFTVLKGVAEYRKKPDPVDVVELGEPTLRDWVIWPPEPRFKRPRYF